MLKAICLKHKKDLKNFYEKMKKILKFSRKCEKIAKFLRIRCNFFCPNFHVKCAIMVS